MCPVAPILLETTTMTTGIGEPPPPPSTPDSTNQVHIPLQHAHRNTVPENAPLPSPIQTNQPTYTVADSLRDFPSAPNQRYMIQLHLQPTDGCKSFHEMSWIDCVKMFLGLVKAKDPDFQIVKKHGRPSSRNAISTQAQIPTNLAEFEQDFGFNLIIPKSAKYVKVTIIVASNYTFEQMFTGGYKNKIFKRLRTLKWWVNDMHISTQGNLAQIGWLKYAHPVYTCHETLLSSIHAVFGDITPHFDILCKWENKSYQDSSGITKKMRVRVLSILCPRDIAVTVSDIMFDRWLRFSDDNSYWQHAAQGLKNYMFIPYRKTVQFPTSAQLSHLLTHGQWLEKNNDVVYLDRLTSIDSPFTITQYILDNLRFDNANMLGKEITLRMLFNAWTKKDSNGKILPSITAIEKIDGKKFALLTHVDSVYELYGDVQRVVEVLSQCPGWEDLCGTNGGAICTSPKVNPLLLRNAYLDAATSNSLGIQAPTPSRVTTHLFNSNVRTSAVRNPYKSPRDPTLPMSKTSNTTTSTSYANAVTQPSGYQQSQQPSASTTVTNYVTPSTLQRELQLLRTSFTDMAKSICTDVCTDMITPVIQKIDDTHEEVHHMKNDFHQLSTLKEDIKQQQVSLEQKLDSKFDQLVSILKSNNNASSATSTITSSTTTHSTSSSTPPSMQPNSVTPPSKTSLQQATTNTTPTSSTHRNLFHSPSGNDSDSFDYGEPKQLDMDDESVLLMDVDPSSGTKRTSDHLNAHAQSEFPTATSPSSTVPHHTVHQHITNSNSNNTMIVGGTGSAGSQKPTGIFIKASALMTSHSSIPASSSESRKGAPS